MPMHMDKSCIPLGWALDQALGALRAALWNPLEVANLEAGEDLDPHTLCDQWIISIVSVTSTPHAL